MNLPGDLELSLNFKVLQQIPNSVNSLLLTNFYTFSCSYKNLDQADNFYLKILSILMTCLLDNVYIYIYIYIYIIVGSYMLVTSGS